MVSDILKQHHNRFQTYLTKEAAAVGRNLQKKVTPSTDYEDYKVLKSIGHGSSGEVVCAQNLVTHKVVAIKIIEKKNLKNKIRLAQLLREIRILNSVNFEFLISLECYFTNSCYVFIVLPYLPGGQFFKLLRNVKKFDEMTARFFAGQVVLAIDYLHSMGIIYRDLKPENLVLDSHGYLKLVDFGFAKKVGKSQTYTFCGTPEYMAPELLQETGYNISPDWWTLGILLFEMCNGTPPFTAKSEYKIYEKILNGFIAWPKHFSSSLRGLIEGLLQVDKTRRLGCMKNESEDVKNHNWFANLNWTALWHKKILSPVKSSRYTSIHPESLSRPKFPKLRTECLDVLNSEIGNVDFEV